MKMPAPNNSFSFNTNRIRFNRTLRALKRVWKTDRHREKERFVLHVFLLPVSNVVESALLRLVSAFQPVSHLQMAFSCNIFFLHSSEVHSFSSSSLQFVVLSLSFLSFFYTCLNILHLQKCRNTFTHWTNNFFFLPSAQSQSIYYVLSCVVCRIFQCSSAHFKHTRNECTSHRHHHCRMYVENVQTSQKEKKNNQLNSIFAVVSIRVSFNFIFNSNSSS